MVRPNEEHEGLTRYGQQRRYFLLAVAAIPAAPAAVVVGEPVHTFSITTVEGHRLSF